MRRSSMTCVDGLAAIGRAFHLAADLGCLVAQPDHGEPIPRAMTHSWCDLACRRGLCRFGSVERDGGRLQLP